MEERTVTIRLSNLLLHEETQQRATDPETVELYAARMSQGDRFPPIKVVRTQKGCVPWDGFHRIEAAQRAGVSTLEAYVRQGTRLDAIRLSYQANGKNGRPLTPEQKAAIVTKVYLDKELYNSVTHEVIGGWVGLTGSGVSKIISRLRTSRNVNRPDTGCPDTTFGSDSDREDRDPSEQTVSTPATDGKPAAKEADTDSLGVQLTERLKEVWEKRDKLRKFVRDLDQIAEAFRIAIKVNDELFRFVRPASFRVEMANLRRVFTWAMPYGTCPYCGGDGGVNGACRACQGGGWLPKEMWDAAPRELKEQTRARAIEKSCVPANPNLCTERRRGIVAQNATHDQGIHTVADLNDLVANHEPGSSGSL